LARICPSQDMDYYYEYQYDEDCTRSGALLNSPSGA
jgi:hypothetical protein